MTNQDDENCKTEPKTKKRESKEEEKNEAKELKQTNTTMKIFETLIKKKYSHSHEKMHELLTNDCNMAMFKFNTDFLAKVKLILPSE